MLSRHYNSLGLIIRYFLLSLCLVSYFVLNPDQHPRSIKCRLPYVIHMRNPTVFKIYYMCTADVEGLQEGLAHQNPKSGCGLEHWPHEMEPEGRQYQDALGCALLPDIQGKLGMSYVQTSQVNSLHALIAETSRKGLREIIR